MRKHLLTLGLIFALLFSCGCTGGEKAGPGSAAASAIPGPTETIEILDDPYVPFYTRNISEVVKDSDCIITGIVEEVYPGELSVDDSAFKAVHTPALIRVLTSLKGSYKPGDTFEILQSGGVGGGVDFRPHSMYLHTKGATYLFFLANGYPHYSEQVANGLLDGFFFYGKTVDETAAIINECIQTGKLNVKKDMVQSMFLSLPNTDGSSTGYLIDKSDLELRIDSTGSVGHDTMPIAYWDSAKWDAFVTALEKCGVFNWEREYSKADGSDGPGWSLNFELDTGEIYFYGENAYPAEWEAFLKIIKKYTGTLPPV